MLPETSGRLRFRLMTPEDVDTLSEIFSDPIALLSPHPNVERRLRLGASRPNPTLRNLPSDSGLQCYKRRGASANAASSHDLDRRPEAATSVCDIISGMATLPHVTWPSPPSRRAMSSPSSIRRLIGRNGMTNAR